MKECGIILDHLPDLATAVVDGSLALAAAFEQAKEAKDAAERHQRMVDELAGTKFAALIDNGSMTVPEAWAAMASALAALDLLENPDNRAWTIQAARDYPDAVPRPYRSYYSAEAIRKIAGSLICYADEMENANAA